MGHQACRTISRSLGGFLGGKQAHGAKSRANASYSADTVSANEPRRCVRRALIVASLPTPALARTIQATSSEARVVEGDRVARTWLWIHHCGSSSTRRFFDRPTSSALLATGARSASP